MPTIANVIAQIATCGETYKNVAFALEDDVVDGLKECGITSELAQNAIEKALEKRIVERKRKFLIVS